MTALIYYCADQCCSSIRRPGAHSLHTPSTFSRYRSLMTRFFAVSTSGGEVEQAVASLEMVSATLAAEGTK